jgi:hypothetical protein
MRALENARVVNGGFTGTIQRDVHERHERTRKERRARESHE